MTYLSIARCVVLGLVWGLGPGAVLAQDPAQQLARGEKVYARRCAACHGANGEGKTAPSLVGPHSHLSGYGTAEALFDYTRRVMPADRPGQMHEVQYWAVLAYLLKENGLLPPDTALESASAPRIVLDRCSPEGAPQELPC